MRLRWSKTTNRTGGTFASARVSRSIALEIVTTLAFSDAGVVAIIKLNGRRWRTECRDVPEAKRVLVRMARALGDT